MAAQAWLDSNQSARSQLDLLTRSIQLLPQSFASNASGVGLALTLQQSILIIGAAGSGKSALLQAMIVAAERFSTYSVFHLLPPLRLVLPNPATKVPKKEFAWAQHVELPSLTSAFQLLSLYPTESLLQSIAQCFNELFPSRSIGLLLPGMDGECVTLSLNTKVPLPNEDPLSSGEYETLYYLILFHLIRHSRPQPQRVGEVKFPPDQYAWSEFSARADSGAYAAVTVLLEESLSRLQLGRRKAVWESLLHSTHAGLRELFRNVHFVIATNVLELAQTSCFDHFCTLFHIGSERRVGAPLLSSVWPEYFPPAFKRLPVDVFDRTHFLLPLRRNFMVACVQIAAALVAPLPKMYVEGEHDLPVYSALFRSFFDVRSTGGTKTLLPFMEGQRHLHNELRKQQLFAEELFTHGPVGIIDLDQRQLKEVDYLRKEQQVFSLTVSSLENFLICPELLYTLYGDGSPDVAGTPARDPCDLLDAARMKDFLKCERMVNWNRRLSLALEKALLNLQTKFADNSFAFDLAQLTKRRLLGNPLLAATRKLLEEENDPAAVPRQFAPGLPKDPDYFTVLSCLRGHTWEDREQDKSADAANPEKVLTTFWQIWTPDLSVEQCKERSFHPHVEAVVKLFQQKDVTWRRTQLDHWILRKDSFDSKLVPQPRTFQPLLTDVSHSEGSGYITMTQDTFKQLVLPQLLSHQAPTAFALSFPREICTNEWAVKERHRYFQDRDHHGQFKSNLSMWTLPKYWVDWFTFSPAQPGNPLPKELPFLKIEPLAYAISLLHMQSLVADLGALKSQKDVEWWTPGCKLLDFALLLWSLPGQQQARGAYSLVYRLLMERKCSKGEAPEFAHLRSQAFETIPAKVLKRGPCLLSELLNRFWAQLAKDNREAGKSSDSFQTFGELLLNVTCRVLPSPFCFWLLEEVFLQSKSCAPRLFTRAFTSLCYLLHEWSVDPFDWKPFQSHLTSFQAYCALQNKWYDQCARLIGTPMYLVAVSAAWKVKPSPDVVDASHEPHFPTGLQCATAFLCGVLPILVNGFHPSDDGLKPILHHDPYSCPVRSLFAATFQNCERYEALRNWLKHRDPSEYTRELATLWRSIGRFLSLPSRPQNAQIPRNSLFGQIIFLRVTLNVHTPAQGFVRVIFRLLHLGSVYDGRLRNKGALPGSLQDEWIGSSISAKVTWAKFLQTIRVEVMSVSWNQQLEELRELIVGELVNSATQAVAEVHASAESKDPHSLQPHDALLLQVAAKCLTDKKAPTDNLVTLRDSMQHSVTCLCNLGLAALKQLHDSYGGKSRLLVGYIEGLGTPLRKWFAHLSKVDREKVLSKSMKPDCHFACVQFVKTAQTEGFKCEAWHWLLNQDPPPANYSPLAQTPLDLRLVQNCDVMTLISRASPRAAAAASR